MSLSYAQQYDEHMMQLAFKLVLRNHMLHASGAEQTRADGVQHADDSPGVQQLCMRTFMLLECVEHERQAGGSTIQLAQVCQRSLSPLQLPCEALYVWQTCMHVST